MFKGGVFSTRFRFLSGNTEDTDDATQSNMWRFYLIVLGAIFDVVSTLLPWSALRNRYYLFLPWSVPWGAYSSRLPLSHPIIEVSIAIRVAAGVAWIAILLRDHVKKRSLFHGAILASGFLSFAAVALFALRSYYLSWGWYLALAGGLFKVFGSLSEVFEVEVVLEDEGEPQKT